MGLIHDQIKARGGDGDGPLQSARRELSMFREASFMHSAVELPAAGDMYRRYASLMYFMGAVRYTAVQQRLDESGFVLLASEFLEGVGYTRGEVETAVSDLAYSRFKPRGKEAFAEGTRTIELWQQGHDNDAPMRLAELLKQW